MRVKTKQLAQNFLSHFIQKYEPLIVFDDEFGELRLDEYFWTHAIWGDKKVALHIEAEAEMLELGSLKVARSVFRDWRIWDHQIKKYAGEWLSEKLLDRKGNKLFDQQIALESLEIEEMTFMSKGEYSFLLVADQLIIKSAIEVVGNINEGPRLARLEG